MLRAVRVIAVSAAVTLVACGGNPVRPSNPSPDPPSSATTTQPVPPAPAPPSQPTLPPSPAPAPAPAPAPTPAPTPAPQPEMQLDASTDGGYWPDPSKALPPTFTIEVWSDVLVVNGQRIARTDTPEQFGIFAKDGNVSFQMTRGQLAHQWTWQYNGPAGVGSGTAMER